MSAMTNSSPSRANAQPTLPSPVAGQKRPAPPTLLPAFEPFSSSPGHLRPSKRQACGSSPSAPAGTYYKYPTPILSSTTGILSSSPPQIHSRPSQYQHQNHHNYRSISSVSERAPLAAVPTISLPENGDVLKLGRSSNSSNYQLSANRLISRVHVEARYIAATVPLEPNKIEIKCKGWNGLKLHCSARTWSLNKDDTFTSETEFAEIMLDVQDARVSIMWPGRDSKDLGENQSDSSWDDENSPQGKQCAVNAHGQVIYSSPLRCSNRIASPESPTPAGPPVSTSHLADLFESVEPGVVLVYEDAASPEVPNFEDSFTTTQAAISFTDPLSSQDPESSEPDAEDPDEENDPIVHSFGPFGANISSRLAAFSTQDPTLVAGRSPSPTQATRSGSSDSNSTDEPDPTPIINHVINQLAYSPKSSTPLSDLFANLPVALKHHTSSAGSPLRKNKGFTKSELQRLLNGARCIGEIGRQGFDAAGKPLESQYYYIPADDPDQARRQAVEGLRKPSLRNCRKQHKQYYWKKPKTP